jgi:hypothetical protein
VLRDSVTRGPRVRHPLRVAAMLLLGFVLPCSALAQANPLLEMPNYTRESLVPRITSHERDNLAAAPTQLIRQAW